VSKAFRGVCVWFSDSVTIRPPTNIRSTGQRSRSRGHKVQKHIESDRVAGVSYVRYASIVKYQMIRVFRLATSILQAARGLVFQSRCTFKYWIHNDCKARLTTVTVGTRYAYILCKSCRLRVAGRLRMLSTRVVAPLLKVAHRSAHIRIHVVTEKGRTVPLLMFST